MSLPRSVYYGDGLQVKNWLSVQTIGNARSLTAAYGAAELLVLGTLLWGLFTAVEIVRKQETRLQPRETPGERTVILSGLPRRCPRAELPSRVARPLPRRLRSRRSRAMSWSQRPRAATRRPSQNSSCGARTRTASVGTIHRL